MLLEAFALARSSWLSRLQHARNEEDIVALAWDFLDHWSPLEVALLPPGAWPRRPNTADELIDTALRLERIVSAHGERGGSLSLRELAAFFNQASIRALQLQLGTARRGRSGGG